MYDDAFCVARHNIFSVDHVCLCVCVRAIVVVICLGLSPDISGIFRFFLVFVVVIMSYVINVIRCLCNQCNAYAAANLQGEAKK